MGQDEGGKKVRRVEVGGGGGGGKVRWVKEHEAMPATMDFSPLVGFLLLLLLLLFF